MGKSLCSEERETPARLRRQAGARKLTSMESTHSLRVFGTARWPSHPAGGAN